MGEVGQNSYQDGGYAWVVLAAVFGSFVLGSLAMSFGMLLPCFLEAFEADEVVTASVGSAQLIVMFSVGVLAGSLCDTFGCRRVAVAGVLLVSVGFVITAFATSVLMLYLGYAVVAGVGFGMHYVSQVVVVSQYFKRKITLAMGIANSGVGVGMFVLAPLITGLRDEYGWRGCLLILAAIFSNGLVLAGFLRPPPRRNAASTSKFEPETGGENVDEVPKVKKYGQQVDRMQISSFNCENEISPKSKDAQDVIRVLDSDTYLPNKHADYMEDVKLGSKSKDHQYDVLSSNCSNVQQQTFGSAYTETGHISVQPGKEQDSLCSKVRESVLNMLDYHVFCDVYVIAFTCVQTAMSVAQTALYMFMALHCHDAAGLVDYRQAMVMSFIGVGDNFGRIGAGVLGMHLPPELLYLASTLLTAAFFLVVSSANKFLPLLLSNMMISFGLGGFVSMSTSSLTLYVGPAHFARAYGFLLLGSMAGSGAAGPLGALIYKHAGSYAAVFRAVAICPLLASALLVAILIIRKSGCRPVHPNVAEKEQERSNESDIIL